MSEGRLPGELVAVPAGAELRDEPSHRAQLLAMLPAGMLPLVEWRERWGHVRFGAQAGWVDLERWRPGGGTGHPPPIDCDFERLTAARRELGQREEVRRLGPFTLYTDVRDTALLGLLDRLAGGVDAAYRARYGLAPEPARQAIVLFAEEADYRRFEAGDERLATLGLDASTSGGVAVLHVGEATARGLGRTLVHELVHLLNSRAFLTPPPPWLDEGLAGDLALSRLGPRGEIAPGELDRRSIRYGPRIEISAPLAWLDLLVEELGDDTRPPLRSRLELSREDFQTATDRPLLYALYAFWCSYLSRRPAFAAFLAVAANGGPGSPEALAEALATPWSDLEADFEAWLAGLPARLGLPRSHRR